MKKDVLEELEKRCEERGVRLMYDDLKGEGGLCRLRDQYYVIVNRRASVETRVRIIKAALEQIPVRESVEVRSPEAELLDTAEPTRVESPEVAMAGVRVDARPER